ncbi:hypothetical protein NUU61_003701 [Penicillium alfredii]|uniref:Mediator of RNA polymerase II transcription subunit 14 n=1 Tax=Penicillium alfredii TaxID=1506179 RepID=A0A9W9FJX8_9EURO|nr:uncharacterized protein NUU61_003701 [Penicillium alfredii]KAJ5101479.1 hypothetical protein NUU61_003701 [Penicillium alfredii]
MPGVVMDNANIEGATRRPGPDETSNGALGSYGGPEKTGQLSSSVNRTAHVNGTTSEVGALNQHSKALGDTREEPEPPFELPHITQGFFPFGTLINRAVQQCWNDLSEVITELAAIQVPHQEPAVTSIATGTKPPGNQLSENVHKKLRLLDFAHDKRAEFIKLLVLSQWSRQAADVSRLIDIQGFIRTRHQAYDAALQYAGEMKRDLVRAQVANPDLRTALEVLSRGRVKSLPDLGYKPPKSLTARTTLKKLQKINRIISVRLALHDQVPLPLQTYRVHDGRVTFTVPGEFELDLSVAEESKTSQFFFVDIRFLYLPSSPIPKGRVFNEIDAKLNDILRDDGLMGCFAFLHGLVLTNKVSILFKQATDLARGLWADTLHIELLHRTLVVQYWPLRTAPKSWLEIGLKSGHRHSGSSNLNSRMPYLGLRWMRDGQEADSDHIQFDSNMLSLEQVLRSVIALHTSHLLSTTFTTLRKNLLFSNNVLSIQAQLSQTEPGDCHLTVQLTATRHLRVSIEPMSGTITMSGVLSPLQRYESDRSPNKLLIEELLSRICRLRCLTAVEEIESGTKAFGLEVFNQRGLSLDARRVFPSNVLRSSFFTHRLWDRHWVAAATSSMDGDSWWLVRLRPAGAVKTQPYGVVDHRASLPFAHLVSSTLVPRRPDDHSACAELVHGLTGMLAVYSNARCLANLPGIRLHPPLEKLQLGADLQVPDLYFHYKAADLPPALRVALPSGLERRFYLQNTVRLSFHGIDRRSHSVLLMAHGCLKSRIKSFIPLISQADPSIITQGKGGGFALRLLVPAGHSIVICLFERLQRLECVLSILESLIRKGMRPQSLSLLRIAFAYGSEIKHSAYFDIKISGPPSSTYLDVANALLQTEPLFHLQLDLGFDNTSPHRRIQESLTATLNHSFTATGVEKLLELMFKTFPLLRALDQITSKPSSVGTFIVHITVRGPTIYQIHYPRLQSRFQLFADPRGRPIWVLKDANLAGQSHNDQVAATIRQKLYDSKGDCWKGMGDGAVVAMDKVEKLILELHECLSDPHLEPNRPESKGKPDQPPAVPLRPTKGPAVSDNQAKASPQKKAGPGNTDIITID